MRPMEQRTILVTGATDGLGRALAADLAARGATVLVHGRDDRRGHDTLEEIRAAVPAARLHWYRADLASLDEVRELAQAVSADHKDLDTLVNNAGIGTTVPGGGVRQESADGHELRFAVNYLAGYLLTRLLLPVLRESAPSRIVNVSSLGQAPIDFGDVMLAAGYSGVRAYCQSKLAQVMFTVDLAEELAGTGVTVNALHPATYIRQDDRVGVSELREGVEATLRLITDPDLDEVSGRFFDGLRPSQALEQAYDAGARARLRELSENLSKARPPAD
ncbi:SDR family NAD(P)-dependent oxidoreductase [Nonomuraea angiospora]|uniref:SDR family NAD(P)-dependent oxidoreductase n=1 Tax=Nonomuraea angiospora TaxID=46172 RepID=UPI00343CFF7E